MADKENGNDKQTGGSIDYGAEQSKIDKQKAEQRDADKERLAAESAD